MKTTAVFVLALFVCAGGLASTPSAGAPQAEPPASSANDAAIVHLLNRITFGPRPCDVARVRAMGVERYLDEQLHPERIPDTALDARLASFTTLSLSSGQIADDYLLPAQRARRQRALARGQSPDFTGPRAESTSSPQPAMKPADPIVQRANLPLVELSEQKILRAAYGERQLEDVLTDFWFNHFNVDARKGPERALLTEYEREVIRPHVLGHFRDLLEATAKSPAMLFYLDNWRSKAGDINENYGRELLELHTLGVDSGYTQQDVIEVARCFTGWTIQRPGQGGGFVFRPRLHDEGEKVVLGHRIRAGGGIHDGEEVLDLIASSPATAHHIAFELAQRFVSDTPPASLVDRAAATFRSTHGDLRKVVRTILTSPEFAAASDDNTKFKTPFEFVVSAIRTTGADVQNARPLVAVLRQMGEPLYTCQPPTGYPDTADRWISSGALLARMNFAVALAADRIPGTQLASSPAAMQSLATELGSPAFQRK
ncbi:MAG TPA: DUF1800 domain-containing protein [Vicinamibacterales bacterium]